MMLLAAAALAATLAFSMAQHTFAWIMLLPAVALPWWRITRAPVWLVRSVRSAAQLTCVAVVSVGVFLSLFPIDPAFGPKRTILALGYWMPFLIAILLLGLDVWTPESALIPLTLALLVAASFQLRVNVLPYVAIAGVCLFLHLAPPGWRSARVRRLALHAALSLALAWFGARGLWVSQDWIERTLYGVFSAASTFQPGLFADAELGSLEELKLSPKVVMRVWSSRPQKLRGRAFPYFDGHRWHAHETMKGIPNSPALGALPFDSELMPDEPTAITTTIVPRAPDRVILAPAGAISIQAQDALRMDAYQVLTWTGPASDRYVVRHRREGRMVRPGDLPLPRWRDSGERMRDMCLLLPPKLDPRVRELAAKLADEAESPMERVRHTVDYLKTNYAYTLKPGKFHTSDAMAEFLFEKKKGYCEYFATSAAVLLRLQGVPTRYITGYAVQAGDRKGDHYVVREKDSHAWIEAYIPGTGWIEADPTPLAEYEAMTADASDTWLDAAWEWVQVTAQNMLHSLLAGDWRALFTAMWALVWPAFAFFAAVFGIVRLWRWWRGRSRRAPAALPVRASTVEALDPALAGVLAALDGRWQQMGHPRPASRAPLEHALSLPPDATAREAVDRIYLACFASQPLSAAEVDALSHSIAGDNLRGPLT